MLKIDYLNPTQLFSSGGYPSPDDIIGLDKPPRYPPKYPDKGGKDKNMKDDYTTLNDDANPNKPGIRDPNIPQNSIKPNIPTDSLQLRMSTTISGIIIGIVASIVIAILILIFAVYKYKNRTEIAQHAIRIDTIKLDPMNSSNNSNTYNNNNHNTYDSSRTSHPYSLGTPGKSIIKNGGGGSSTINTLTRASIDHLHDSKEWYV